MLSEKLYNFQYEILTFDILAYGVSFSVDFVRCISGMFPDFGTIVSSISENT